MGRVPLISRRVRGEVSMHTMGTFNRRSVSLSGVASRFMAIALLFFVCMSASTERVAAGSRTTGAVGAGIVGGIILNELATGSGKRKASSSTKRTGTARQDKSTKSSSRKRDDDDVVESKKGSVEPAAAKGDIATGSTNAPEKGTAATAQGGSSLVSTPDEIKAAQQHLKFMGYDIVQENGTVDPKTKSAVMQFQDSIGAPVTGDLTVEQLQTLFKKVASKKTGS
jgi:Putative peptidoglycan binding domain